MKRCKIYDHLYWNYLIKLSEWFVCNDSITNMIMILYYASKI
jgi:hypothetical protein